MINVMFCQGLFIVIDVCFVHYDLMCISNDFKLVWINFGAFKGPNCDKLLWEYNLNNHTTN